MCIEITQNGKDLFCSKYDWRVLVSNLIKHPQFMFLVRQSFCSGGRRSPRGGSNRALIESRMVFVTVDFRDPDKSIALIDGA